MNFTGVGGPKCAVSSVRIRFNPTKGRLYSLLGPKRKAMETYINVSLAAGPFALLFALLGLFFFFLWRRKIIHYEWLIWMSREEHDFHVQAVLQHLLKHFLFVKAEKCQFQVESVSFLGFIISKGNIHPPNIYNIFWDLQTFTAVSFRARAQWQLLSLSTCQT